MIVRRRNSGSAINNSRATKSYVPGLPAVALAGQPPDTRDSTFHALRIVENSWADPSTGGVSDHPTHLFSTSIQAGKKDLDRIPTRINGPRHPPATRRPRRLHGAEKRFGLITDVTHLLGKPRNCCVPARGLERTPSLRRRAPTERMRAAPSTGGDTDLDRNVFLCRGGTTKNGAADPCTTFFHRRLRRLPGKPRGYVSTTQALVFFSAGRPSFCRAGLRPFGLRWRRRS